MFGFAVSGVDSQDKRVQKANTPPSDDQTPKQTAICSSFHKQATEELADDLLGRGKEGWGEYWEILGDEQEGWLLR